jgi:hypothetical protein
MATKTTNYYKNGELDRTVTSKQPFLFNKGVNLNATIAELGMKMVDPNTGNPAPSANINFGDTGAKTIPLTSGNDNVQEIFGTYQETFSYDRSMWGAEIGSMEYSISAGGIGCLTLPTSSKAERIDEIMGKIKAFQNSFPPEDAKDAQQE